MIILGIDTTSSSASVALLDDQKLIGEYTSNARLTHLQKLMPMVDHLLLNCEMSFQDVEIIGVSQGPGSFTGIRIGVSAAKALSQVGNLPIIGVPTLKALAYNIPFYSGIVCPILDARRHQVYGAAFQWQKGICNEVIKADAYGIEALLSQLTGFEDIMFLGDGVPVYKESIMEILGDRATFAPQYLAMQKASSVAQLALKMATEGNLQNSYEMKPDYLRKSEAERNLKREKKANE